MVLIEIEIRGWKKWSARTPINFVMWLRPPWGAQGRIQLMLRAAQARNSLAQPQLRAAYSSLMLQSHVLRSQSGNVGRRGQDLGVSNVVFRFTY
jgi:hypothetical protein